MPVLLNRPYYTLYGQRELTYNPSIPAFEVSRKGERLYTLKARTSAAADLEMANVSGSIFPKPYGARGSDCRITREEAIKILETAPDFGYCRRDGFRDPQCMTRVQMIEYLEEAADNFHYGQAVEVVLGNWKHNPSINKQSRFMHVTVYQHTDGSGHRNVNYESDYKHQIANFTIRWDENND